MKYLLTIIYILLTVLGLFLLKIGGNSMSITLKPFFQVKIGYITILGLISYIFSFLLWQKLLVTYDVTYIVPLTAAIVQIIVLIIGTAFFKEHIGTIGIIGIIVAIIGIVLITIGKK